MHVILSDDALSDLDQIWDFVAPSSVASADRLLEALIDFSRNLGQMLNRFLLVEGDVSFGVRRANFRTWAIFFRVSDTHVDVVRIVHGGRDLDRLRL